jgi:F-type H+-transporting ATPase subunit epsilon
MADQIHLEIVTPLGVELRVSVNELTAPSVEGDFGVLPGHRPLLAALRTGIVTYRIAGEVERVAVGPGFVEVADDRAVLLTDSFIKKDAVDPVQARLELKEADESLEHFDGTPDSSEYDALVLAELWAAAKLELYGDPPPPTLRVGGRLQRAPETYSAVSQGAPLTEAALDEVER